MLPEKQHLSYTQSDKLLLNEQAEQSIIIQNNPPAFLSISILFNHSDFSIVFEQRCKHPRNCCIKVQGLPVLHRVHASLLLRPAL
jgi:hypothetical protein